MKKENINRDEEDYKQSRFKEKDQKFIFGHLHLRNLLEIQVVIWGRQWYI